ncbi:Hypothetical predicted protein [Paramuricea clavata]|uniref:Uncharacterized protein n=1 Tax=Paramuricea clavata TaxID=317549 RepID=A0A7D9IUK0_PARCT|nr:Hypothetical predicted protein [Paramuricea clavata]
MNTTESELQPGFRRSCMTTIKGPRTRSVVTFNPTTISPGEELYINIPKLKPSSCLVPGSLAFLFDFKNSNTKSRFSNNLAKLLAKRLQVKVAGKTAYDCSGESLFEVYKDLWLTLGRKKMTEQGLASENLRKLISGDDTGVKVGDAGKVADALLHTIYGSKLRKRIDKIIADHGLYVPFFMNNNPMYILTLPQADEIMTAQGGKQVDGYKLANLELEYETIENDTLTSEVSRMYSTGRSLSYKHVTLMRTSNWDKDLTIVNANINIPRKSMSAIVLLFTNRVRTDSEEYIYPNIDNVNVTIEGVPNAVFSQGLPKNRFFEEAKRFFCPMCEKTMADEFMSISKFFSNGFALVIDLRSTQDDTTGGGKKIVNTQSGVYVLLEIKKRATTSDVQCNIFVVSDALLNFANRDLSSIQY